MFNTTTEFYNKNSRLRNYIEYNNGKKNGIFKKFSYTNNVRAVGQYLDDELSGFMFVYKYNYRNDINKVNEALKTKPNSVLFINNENKYIANQPLVDYINYYEIINGKNELTMRIKFKYTDGKIDLKTPFVISYYFPDDIVSIKESGKYNKFINDLKKNVETTIDKTTTDKTTTDETERTCSSFKVNIGRDNIVEYFSYIITKYKNENNLQRTIAQSLFTGQNTKYFKTDYQLMVEIIKVIEHSIGQSIEENNKRRINEKYETEEDIKSIVEKYVIYETNVYGKCLEDLYNKIPVIETENLFQQLFINNNKSEQDLEFIILMFITTLLSLGIISYSHTL